jgi:hypothetical protein
MARYCLSQKEMFVLADIMKAKYVKSGLDDVKFAELVNVEHKDNFRGLIGRTHISTMRDTLDIQSNRPYKTKAQSEGECLHFAVRIQALEDQVGKLTVTVAKLVGAQK